MCDLYNVQYSLAHFILEIHFPTLIRTNSKMTFNALTYSRLTNIALTKSIVNYTKFFAFQMTLLLN